MNVSWILRQLNLENGMIRPYVRQVVFGEKYIHKPRNLGGLDLFQGFRKAQAVTRATPKI